MVLNRRAWNAPTQDGKGLPASMRTEEYDRLQQLLDELRPEQSLEVGMANGTSTVVICETLHRLGRGRHTAIDPFQSAAEGWNRQGIEAVHRAGVEAYLDLIEDFDYLALPRLVEQKRRFDFILIDGWHSFDYTFLDIFYADLLLREGGVLAIHDTDWPAVYKACRFLETHKPYDRIGPPLSVSLKSLPARLMRRVNQIVRGPRFYQEARSRRCEWFSLGAYRKRADKQVPNDFYTGF